MMLGKTERLSSSRVFARSSLGIVVLFILALCFVDFEIQSRDPWFTLGLWVHGFASPSLPAWEILWPAVWKTLAFALQGVFIASLLGFALAHAFCWRWVRVVAAALRAVHELFWALLFIQFLGLSSLSGLLAIVLPYTGFFAKVFAEMLEECDRASSEAMAHEVSRLNRWFFGKVVMVWPMVRDYISYRMECGLRSSAVLGFVGLPTLGYEMETFFRQGQASEGAGLLYVFILLILSLKWSFRCSMLPVVFVVSLFALPPRAEGSFDYIVDFLGRDIWPKSLLEGDAQGLWEWLCFMWREQAQEGVINSLVLGQCALVASGVLALLAFPFRSVLFFGPLGRSLGHTALVVTRSLPEYLLAFLFLLCLGPSMLPAVLALSLHNGAIVAHLLALQSKLLVLRDDASSGLNRYAFEVLPRLYGSFLALLLYRYEMILRETAILGMLGIPTLGFYIDSAFEDFRFDRAFFLIVIGAILNIFVDVISQRLRRCIQLNSTPESSV